MQKALYECPSDQKKTARLVEDNEQPPATQVCVFCFGEMQLKEVRAYVESPNTSNIPHSQKF